MCIRDRDTDIICVPVLLYASETWVVSRSTENALGTFERKILGRIIFTRLMMAVRVWRKRTNKELYGLLHDMAKIKKIVRIVTSCCQDNPHNPVKGLLLYVSDGKKKLGWPKLRRREGSRIKIGKESTIFLLLGEEDSCMGTDTVEQAGLQQARTRSGL